MHAKTGQNPKVPTIVSELAKCKTHCLLHLRRENSPILALTGLFFHILPSSLYFIFLERQNEREIGGQETRVHLDCHGDRHATVRPF